ncbi:MAG: AI-2E family transporter [Armatimonadetes bacterium]|nr:AI-2E family transporter [Armatimonadota bacterium]
MDKESLQRKVLLLALTAGRRVLNMGLVAGLLGLFALGVWFLHQVHIVASILSISILLAYVLVPMVNFLARPIELLVPTHMPLSRWNLPLRREPRTYVLMSRGLPRIVAITMVYALMLVLLALALAYVIPVVNEQFMALTRNLENLIANLQVNIDAAYDWINERVPSFLQPYIEQIDPESLRLENWTADLQTQLPDVLGSTASGVFLGMKFAAGLLAAMVLVPLFTFYILLDADRYSRAFMRLVPRKWKPEAAVLLREIDLVLGRYIRGQLIVCVTIGFSIAVALNLMGVEYATLIGVFAGIIDIIPYVGVAMGIVPAFIIALVQHGLLFAIAVVAVMELIHWTEGHIVVPAVIGHSVGLPPLIVMIALGAGYELGGIMGMVLAIPAAAIIRVLGNYCADRLEKAENDPEEPPASEQAGDERGLEKDPEPGRKPPGPAGSDQANLIDATPAGSPERVTSRAKLREERRATGTETAR